MLNNSLLAPTLFLFLQTDVFSKMRILIFGRDRFWDSLPAMLLECLKNEAKETQRMEGVTEWSVLITKVFPGRKPKKENVNADGKRMPDVY